jgi:hypothetical protein
VVRDAFAARGHDAWSCDYLHNDTGNHYEVDVMEILGDGWDMMIAHPPCTYLAIAANGWLTPERIPLRKKALEFVLALANANIPRIAIENPVGVLSTLWRKPDQVLQPFEFGHPYSKRTCYWLKGLYPLTPTDIVQPIWHYWNSGKRRSAWDWEIHQAARDENERAKLRSITPAGIAQAMASQWDWELQSV